MKNNTNSSVLFNYLLLTRPYSWIDIIFTGILAYSVSTSEVLTFGKSIWIGTICLLLWAALNWYSERIQKDEGRIQPGLRALGVVFAGSLILITIQNPLALIIYFIHTIFIIVYPYKKTKKYLGRVGFLLRGIHTLSLFFLIAILFKSYNELIFNTRFLMFGVSLFLIQSSRSLIADIRDVNNDKYEFPARYGAIISFIFAAVLFVIPLFFLPIKAFISFLPLVITSMIFLCIFRNNLSVAAYFIHRVFIFNFAIFKMVISFNINNTTLLLIILTTITGLLNITYLMVPRPSNTQVLELFNSKNKNLLARISDNRD
ncbi:MAG: hypothetical protein ACE14V_01055 [bacterium]